MELRNIDVNFISLVKKPATGLGVILKSGENPGGLIKAIEIIKAVDEKYVLYGIVYTPDKPDSYGDFANAVEIEKAAHKFMQHMNLKNVDVEHQFVPVDGACVCESWIVRSGDELFPEYPGAWAVGIKVNNIELWAQLKSGEITGLSMAAVADGIETKKTDGLVKRIIEGVKEYLATKQLKEDSTLDETQVRTIVSEEINKAVKGIVDGLTAQFTDVTKGIADISGRLTNIEAIRKSADSVADTKTENPIKGIF